MKQPLSIHSNWFNSLKTRLSTEHPPGMATVAKILEHVLPEIIESERFEIYYPMGIASELYIKSRFSRPTNVELMCQSRSTAAFLDGFEASIEVDCTTFVVEHFAIKIKDRDALDLDLADEPVLHLYDFIYDEFRSFCDKVRYSLGETAKPLTYWTHLQSVEVNEWTFLRVANSKVTLGYGKTNDCILDHSKAESTIVFFETIKCLNWPGEVEKWFSRERKYGLPSKEVKDEVMRGGCHIFQGQESFCQKPIWHVSFSRAEQIVISSWNTVQQVVYYLLSLLHDLDLRSHVAISQYDVKTLMLWACEQNPSQYWARDKIVQICQDLLGELKRKLLDQELIHYFLGFNLFSRFEIVQRSSVEDFACYLDQYCSGDNLNKWFEENYMTSEAAQTIEGTSEL